MKKQYIFIFLIIIMLYLLYLVVSYKYKEYVILRYTDEIIEINNKYLQQIEKSQQILVNRTTKAYKNKVLKSEQNLKNPGEEVIFFIDESQYNTFTWSWETSWKEEISLPLDREESLVQTMTIPQKWMYMIFKKDTR